MINFNCFQLRINYFYQYIDLDSVTDDYQGSSYRYTMTHQVVSTFFSYPLNGGIHVCQSLHCIGTMMPSILAPHVFRGMQKFCSPSQLVPAESQVGTIQLKCNSSGPNEARDRQIGFLSFLNYYYLITGINLNEQTINFAPKKSHISRKKSAKIKQSTRSI